MALCGMSGMEATFLALDGVGISWVLCCVIGYEVSEGGRMG